MKNEYQAIARKFRPKLFSEVIGQEVAVTTLVNAIKMKRVGHAYLFCGSKGTGKTTLARLFAKALNCTSLSAHCEPCNNCSSCHEIDSAHSLDVLEIDGASHRGIEDVRQINETIGYLPKGKYKIYIIDEVHMLTKEAFNALLKSLEEPPELVKFFFATTEPHKIPATIMSRCQKFTLSRISVEKMSAKLASIASQLDVTIEREALVRIAELSGGGLRDAESLLDQLISYYGNKITEKGVVELFGVVPATRFEALDKAVFEQNHSFAIQLAEEVFQSGRSIEYFIEEMIKHFRKILLQGIGKTHYTEDQCLNIIEWLAQTENEIKFAFSPRTTLEMVLLRIIRSGRRISLEELVGRLEALEGRTRVQPVLEEKVALPKMEMHPVQEEKVMVISTPPKMEERIIPSQLPKKEDDNKPAIQATSSVKEKSRYDTVTRFAAKELGGSLKKV